MGMLFLFLIILNNLRFGRHVYAIGSNEEAALISGVNVNRTKMIVFALSEGIVVK